MNKRGNGFLWNSDFVSHTDALDLAASHQIVCAILADLENLCELVNRKNKGKLLISRVFHFLTSLLRIILVIFATHPDAGMLKAVCGTDCHSTEAPLPVSCWQMLPYCPSSPWERVSKFHDPLRCHGVPVYHNRV